MENVILKAIERVELELDTVINFDDLADALELTLRKMKLKHKEESYLPLLLETELEELVIRREINRIGVMNQCAVYA